ncbi:MAG: hypothetical protein R2698_15170 [Microthrixaceae bacterium]
MGEAGDDDQIAGPFVFTHDGDIWRVVVGEQLKGLRPAYDRRGQRDYKKPVGKLSDPAVPTRITDQGGYYLVYYDSDGQRSKWENPFMMGKTSVDEDESYFT